MCGIAGWISLTDAPADAEAVRRMTRRLRHRGPDAEGIHAGERVGLGHRRLSIIDLSREANQPMWDATGRYAIVFNGEIYNYEEIRKQIPDYPYRTHSDTETILAAYTQEGPVCLRRFNGMFALAIWDEHASSLFIARDRLGKKPLYYAQTPGAFIFSSEVRSLLSSGSLQPEADTSLFGEYLHYQAPMGAHTLVRGVEQLEAGTYAILRDGALTKTRYWSPSTDGLPDMTRANALARVRELLIDSVRLRLVSDVPVGAFLSGGIDSSLVVACMAELRDEPVDTFTVGMSEKSLDESEWAAHIAKRYNTRHHTITIRPEAFLDHLEDILDDMDSPSGDGPNTWLVSKYTRDAGLKVALSGLGGDELFAGYPKFLYYQRLMRNRGWLSIPAPFRRLMASMVGRFGPASMAKMQAVLPLWQWTLSTLYPVLRGIFSPKEIGRLLKHPPTGDSVMERLRAWDSMKDGGQRLSEATLGEWETYTRDVLLRDTDQMSMAHALEIRVPFFDYRLMEFLLSVPDSIKQPHAPKQLLVEALAPRLPADFANRPKMGFTLPFDRWLRAELRPFAETAIARLAEHPAFHGPEVRSVWTRFQASDPRVGWARVWTLVVLSEWMERHLHKVISTHQD